MVTHSRWKRYGFVGFLLALLLIMTGCRDLIQIRTETVIFDDGSLEYVLTVRGTNSDGERPDSPDGWLEEQAGIRLTEPDVWDTKDISSWRIRARAFFPPESRIPSLLSYRDGMGWHEDQITTEVFTEARVLLRCWFFNETHPEPGGFERLDKALRTVLDATREIYEVAARKQFGDTVDTSAVATVLEDRARPLLMALLRENTGLARATVDSRIEGARQVLVDYDIPVARATEPDAFIEQQSQLLFTWLRDRMAEATLLDGTAVHSDDLTFFPDTENFSESIEQMTIEAYGDWDETAERLEPAFSVLLAYMMGDDGPQVATDRRLRMPGTRIQTNGMAGREETLWLIRDEDLDLNLRQLFAVSARVELGALRSLGIQRDFEESELLQLYDLLWIRDPERTLQPLLEAAVRGGDPELLLDDKQIPEGMKDVVVELYRLLLPEDDD